VITLEAIELSIQVALLSEYDSFYVGFNSLGACASVNHLHLQLYYYDFQSKNCNNGPFPFSIQNVERADELIRNKLWFISETSYYFHCFSLQLSDFNNDIAEFSKKIFLITNYFKTENIPFNISIVRAMSFNNNSSIEKTKTIKTMIWPRKFSKGKKN
jgi:hypothetical protein